MKVKCLMGIFLLSFVLFSCSHEPLKPAVKLRAKMALVSFVISDYGKHLKTWNKGEDKRSIVCNQMDGMVKYAEMQLSKYFDMVPLTQVIEDKTYLKFSSALTKHYRGYHNSTVGCEVWEKEAPSAFYYSNLYFPMIRGTALRMFSVPDADNDPDGHNIFYGVEDCEIEPGIVESLCKSLNVEAVACIYTKWSYTRKMFSLKPTVTDYLAIYTKDGQKAFTRWEYVRGEMTVGGCGPFGLGTELYVDEVTIGGWVEAYEQGLRPLIRWSAGKE